MSASSDESNGSPVNQNRHKPRTAMPPPAPYAAAVLGGWWLDRNLFPIRLDAMFSVGIFGWVFVLAGIGLMTWAVWRMFRHRTTVNPYASASSLCVDGPFAFSRNPIYLADWLILLGISFLLVTLWPILFAPLVWLVMRYCVIRHEEAHLEAIFGDQYLTYKARVRRWL